MAPETPPPQRSTLRTIVSLAIGAGLLVMLLWHTGLDELGDYFDQIEWLSPLILIRTC